MKKSLKGMLAAVFSVTVLCTSMVSMGVGATVNRYSTISPYCSGSRVYFGVTVTNTSGYVSSFNYSGLLYNNVTGALIGSVEGAASQYAIGNGVTVSLIGSKAYDALPDQTRCENHVSAYRGSTIPASAVPYESYVSDTYFNK